MKLPVIILSIVLIASWTAGCFAAATVPDPDPERFEDAIAKFAEEDAQIPPAKGGMVFVGSSSIRMLDIPEVLPGIKGLNRGFGGSHISDVNYYLKETVLQYKPSITVFFCGGNDLWSGKPALQVMEDFREFRDRLFQSVPNGKLIVLATRPSPKRESVFERELALNYLMEIETGKDDRVLFLRGSCDRFFDENGRFFSELYHEDQLHMSALGYQIWREILSPHLKK